MTCPKCKEEIQMVEPAVTSSTEVNYFCYACGNYWQITYSGNTTGVYPKLVLKGWRAEA